MQIIYKNEGVVTSIDPNSVHIIIGKNEYQLTEYVGYLKLVKHIGEETDCLSIQPNTANQILIK